MEEKKCILIVEDERAIVEILKFNLKREGYDTLEALDGEAGLELARTEDPDLILLDVMLPKMNGFDICKNLREAGSTVPIIMLTAREEETDKVFGLEAGADDYMTKPFSMRELMARVRANIRRRSLDLNARASVGTLLTAGALTIEPSTFSVTKSGEPVDLTQKEYDLLMHLIRERGKVFTREDLMQKVWNYDYFGDMRTVDVTVRRLREKIEDASKADWVASDPMPVGGGEIDAVEFIGLYDKNKIGYHAALSGANQPGEENTASFADDAITWDLKQSGYMTETDSGTTTYIYTLRYRVRLQNEQIGFIERKEYETNGKTTLKYRVIETVNGKVQVSDQKTLEFPIPSVEGYLGELTFLKQDNRGNALAGAEFTLTHSDNCKICRGDGVNQVSVAPRMAVSGENGEVNFADIPSGHSYDLEETKVPSGYSKTGEHYVVTVAYDEVTVQVLGPDYKQTGTWGQNEMGVIVNNTYYALPSTGGSGTQWFTVGGLALVLTAGFGLCRIKRRRRREDTASS